MGKKIIVTGGSKGIGLAISKKLLQDGFSVHLCARNEDLLRELATELQEIGNISYSVLDISNKEDIHSFCFDWKDPLYGIVNNAGICQTEMLEEKKEVWSGVLNTNLYGPYFLTKGLLSDLEDNGRIVNISSQLGKEGRAGYGAYCASKFGLIGLTKCWAKELGKRGITVNAVCPGWVNTEMSQKDMVRIAEEKGVSTEDFYKRICEPLELKRFTEPEEVAALIAFLMSEEAGGVTGRDWLMNTIWNQE